MTREEAIEILEANRPDPCYQMLREAVDFAVNALKAQAGLQQNCNQLATDTISRQEVIDAVDDIESEVADGYGFQYAKWREYFCDMPSAQIKIKPVDIDYYYCANAMLKMWIDNVLTDGEYNKIMDKLNDFELRRREKENG